MPKGVGDKGKGKRRHDDDYGQGPGPGQGQGRGQSTSQGKVNYAEQKMTNHLLNVRPVLHTSLDS